MCWEDPQILTKALHISKKDVVLSIASGGENVFALLLKNPKKVIAIDSNLEQIYLVSLKGAAIKALSFEEFAEFIGLAGSRRRIYYFEQCKKYLTKDEIQFWNTHKREIIKGIIYCGKFESYLQVFRTYILPLILTKEQIHHYLCLSTLEQQKRFYYTYWEGIQWRLLFRIFFSKTLMQMLGRDKSYFEHASVENVALHYYTQAKRGITQILAKNNFFMHMILTGTIQTPCKNHPYLDKENYNQLKHIVHTIHYVHNTVACYLEQTEERITKYNLSDIFERANQKSYENMLTLIAKRSPKGTKVCYWNNLVRRRNHGIKNMTKDLQSEKLRKQDRIFFYSDFIIEERN